MIWNFIRLMILLAGALMLAGCSSLPELEKLARPHYRHGPNMKRAAFCATCHPETHQQWKNFSAHAIATSSPGFRRSLAEMKANPALAPVFDEKMCYACHGSKQLGEGINCVSCHGPPLAGADIMDSHEKLYAPRLRTMRKSRFCARCHQVSLPFTHEPLTTVYSEWKHSPAARRGKSCQNCHMARGEDDNYAFHGFRSAMRNQNLYRGWLKIDHLAVNRKRVRLYIHNLVSGHAIPASGLTRVLALNIRFYDRRGRLVHQARKRFFKHFSMLPVIGGAPFMLMENSQLAAGERRLIRFGLPEGIYDKAARLRLDLRMYEVADKYEGNIDHAHWRSRPIISRSMALHHAPRH